VGGYLSFIFVVERKPDAISWSKKSQFNSLSEDCDDETSKDEIATEEFRSDFASREEEITV
jgi:hypothetical protein